MRWTPIVSLLVLGGCSFIDDFDFEIADGSVVAEDGGVPSDLGEPADGGGEDGGSPAECTDPCLSDAADDFGATQGAGPLGWRYLNDTREPTGLFYGELALGTYLEGPAWTDGSPPPAIVDCRASGAVPCSDGELLFAANQPGDGSDPVLSFTAPADGTFVVVVDVLSVDGLASVTVSRLSRLDTVVEEQVAGPATVIGVLDLFEGERGLVTVAPAADPGGEVSIGASVRVSRIVGEPPLDGCELAVRFDGDTPLVADCAGVTFETVFTPGVISTQTTGPSEVHGGARRFGADSEPLRGPGASFDYSGDFTVQLWANVDDIDGNGITIYADASAATAATAGGVRLDLDGTNGAVNDAVSANYLFPLPDGGPPDDPAITCDADSCQGELVAPAPSFDEWHFYRIVRRADRDELRFCIDGQLVGSAFLDGTLDVSNPTSPTLGSNGNTSAPMFEGSVDDVRVFSKALPCGE